MSHDPSLDPKSPFKGSTGARRVFNAFFYSLDGLKAAYLHESAFRQLTWLAVALVPLALWLPLPLLGRALLLACSMLTLMVELLNSAIEAVVDRVSLERHELSKRAKDLGSAAQMICLTNLALMWLLVLLDAKLLRLG